MKSGLVAGAVAGVVSGIISVVVGFIGSESVLGLYSTVPGSIESIIISMIVLTIIFGAIFGVLYSKFYDAVPLEGALKGLSFGLIIWLVKDIASAAYIGIVDRIIEVAIGLVFIGFFMWIVYGLVLGTLYKK